MKKKILVIGATGLVGKAVAEQLNKDGYDVIVMTRNKEKAKEIFSAEFEIIEADVLDVRSIIYSFQGVDGVFISLPERDADTAVRNILKYAGESSVKKIVYASGCTVCEENSWHPMIKGHFEAERAISGSRIPYTILKLTMIMDMIPRYANNGKSFILGKQKHGWSWIHTSDIASMTSKAFENSGSDNKKLTLFGAEKDTIADAVNSYNRVVNPGAKEAKTKPYLLARLLAIMVGKELKYAISIFKYFEDHPEEGDPELCYTLLGEPEMRLNTFFELEKQRMA